MSAAGLVSVTPLREETTKFLPSFPEHSREAILIYISMPGLVVPMRVLESDSIQSVKLQIQSYKGIVTRNQKLVCGGRELSRSNSLVRDYGVSDGYVLHLVLRLCDLQVISVTTSTGKEFTFHVERIRDVGYVRSQIAKKGNLEDIEDHEIIHDGEPIEDQMLVHDLSRNNKDAVLHLFVRKAAKISAAPIGKDLEVSIVVSKSDGVSEYAADMQCDVGGGLESGMKSYMSRKPCNKELFLDPVIVNPNIEIPSEVSELIDSTLEGLECGNYPIRSSEGTGGAYFMPDSSGNKYLAVFKPVDEEPMAVNNPRGLPLSEDGEGLKKGTRVGVGALRECAAYLLDHPKRGRRSFSGDVLGLSGVPPTVFVRCLHKGFNHPGDVTVKTGSLQVFMENSGSCEDMGPSAFPIEEVHKIAVLDMRMANADRHAGNILVTKGKDGKTVLIPIDHGYCLPYSFEDCTFDWLYWPQARQPFNDETAEYILSMDAEKDIELLKFYGWELPLECSRVLCISTMLLKKGVEKGLTPYAIGIMMCRETVRKESVIEEIVREATDSILPGSSAAAFFDSVSTIMDRCLGEIDVQT